MSGVRRTSAIESRQQRENAERIRRMGPGELKILLESELDAFGESEVLAVLDNRFCSGAVCDRIARNPALASYYSVQLRLVRHRATPQGHAIKLAHFIYWPDLLRISIDVRVPPAVRRAIDMQLMHRLRKMTLGEKMSAARGCSRDLLKALMPAADPQVFAAALMNPRLTEDEVVTFISSGRATADQLIAIGDHPKWSARKLVRRALVINPDTPKSVAASQLRYLTSADLAALLRERSVSTYVRRCIERAIGEATRQTRPQATGQTRPQATGHRPQGDEATGQRPD